MPAAVCTELLIVDLKVVELILQGLRVWQALEIFNAFDSMTAAKDVTR
jgi:hypothetical protein